MSAVTDKDQLHALIRRFGYTSNGQTYDLVGAIYPALTESRDKRLVTLSIENRELQTKVAAQAKRIAELEDLLAHGAAARSEMLDEIHARGARITELVELKTLAGELQP